MKIYFVALRFAFSVLTLLIVLLSDFQKSNPPGSVGTSLALETIIQHSPVDFRPIRYVLFLDFVHLSRLNLSQFCIFGLFVCWIDFSLFEFFSLIFHSRNETSSSVLVCSKGGGLLAERMELVNELWEENIKVMALKDLCFKLIA